MRRDITPEDLALYALHLLDEDESFAVEQFVATSPEARHELALLRGDLATYALATEKVVPPALAKQKLMKGLLRERKPAPHHAPELIEERLTETLVTVAHTEKTETIFEVPQSVPAQEPQLLRSFGYASASTEDEEQPKPQRNGWLWALAGLGWATAAAAGVFLFLQVRDNEHLRDTVNSQSAALSIANESAERAQLAWDTITSTSSQRFTLTKVDVRLPATARVFYLPERGALVFQASNLEPLPPQKTYELWLIPSGDNPLPMAAGTFKPDINGNATMMLPPDIPKGITASKFGVTMENDGGATEPSKPILMIGQ